jgi:hypothetical protein
MMSSFRMAAFEVRPRDAEIEIQGSYSEFLAGLTGTSPQAAQPREDRRREDKCRSCGKFRAAG